MGSGGWLDFLFFENIIYIFWRDSLLNVFCFCFCFVIVFLFLKKVLLCGVLRRENKMKDILREAIVEKHHNHVLSSYHYWRCMWLRLSVYEWVFVRIHQGVIWNYFWQTKEHFDCLCFWYWKKKKDRPVLFWLVCSSTLPPSHFIFRLDKIGLLWNRHIIVYIQLLLCVVVNRGGFGQGTRNGTGSRSQSALIQDLSTDDTGWQEKSKKKKNAGTNSAFRRNKKPVCSAFLLQPVWCLSTAEKKNFLTQPVAPLSDRLGHDIKLLLDTNTVTF